MITPKEADALIMQLSREEFHTGPIHEINKRVFTRFLPQVTAQAREEARDQERARCAGIAISGMRDLCTELLELDSELSIEERFEWYQEEIKRGIWEGEG